MFKRIFTIMFLILALTLLPLINCSAVDLETYADVATTVSEYGEQFNISSWADTSLSYVKINGTELDVNNITNFAYNSSVDFYLVWEIPNGSKSELNKILYYPLPEEVRFDNATGTLKDGTTVVGTWEIKDGNLYINYYEDFINNVENNNDLVGTLHIYGKLGLDEPGDSSGEDVKLEFPGIAEYTVHIDKPNVYSDLNIYKSITNSSDLANTLEDREFVLEINSQGTEFNNIVITDTMGSALKLNGDIKLYDADNNEITDFTYSTNDTGFEVKIPNIPANTKYYLKYNVTIDEENINTGERPDNIHFESEKNSAVMSSDELDYNKEATTYVDITKYKVTKTSSYDIDNNIIDYVINVNSGYKTSIDGSIITDTLSDNQEYVTDSFYVEVNGEKTDIEGLNFETLKSGFIFPEGSDDVYTIHYQTTPVGTGITLTNDVTIFSTTDNITNESSTSTYIPNSLDIVKSVKSYDEENQIITWETQIIITEEIGALQYINITDSFNISKMEYVDGSFDINLDSFDPNNVYPSAWGGFSVFLGTYDPGATDKYIQPGIYTMTYQTRVVEALTAGSHVFNNNISLGYNGGSDEADATYTIDVPENALSKLIIRDNDNSQYILSLFFF